MSETDHSEQRSSAATSDEDNAPVPALTGPIDVRNTALIVLAVIASIVFIDWAQTVLLPLVVSVLLSYALDPLVSIFDRIKIPRAISAALILAALLWLLAITTAPLQREAMAMLDKIPDALSEFRRESAFEPPTEESVIEKAQEAAEEIEETASEDEDPRESTEPGVTPVRIVEKPFSLRQYLMTGSGTAVVLFSQFFSVLFLVYFLLAVGNLYKRKVVRIAGPSFWRMRKAVRILDEFHHQVRRFLFVMLLGGIFVGFLTWLAFLLLGVEQAILWGVVAGVASAIPYLGPFLVFVGTAAAAFVQFGELEMSLLVAGTSLIITSVQGYLLFPWLTSQVSSLNAVAIFIGLLFWGWIWGAMGLIVATPLLMIMKSLCDHVRNLRPLGELLGK